MRILTVVLLLALVSCGTPPKVPVSSRDTISSREQTEKIGGEHVTIVRSGDTLYSIAFGAGLKPATVAAWNGMSLDDILNVGRKLRLTKPLSYKKKKVAKEPNDEDVYASTKVRKKTVKKTRVKVLAKKRTIKKTKKSSKKIHWRWPTKGRVISAYNVSRGNKGIDIAGKRGQDIVASSGGKVVYAGDGLRGYGNLIIVKHDDSFLSAYAHNDEIVVREGQIVQQGQKISVMGVAKGGKAVLHFEIRLQGQPVNPVKYLP